MNARSEYKVLIIDDEPSEVKHLIVRLRRYGFTVEYAENATVGLSLAHAMRPNLILCDLRMPYMNGYEFLEAFSHDPLFPETLVGLMDVDWVIERDAINAWSKPTPSGKTADFHWIKPIAVPEYVKWITNIRDYANRSS